MPALQDVIHKIEVGEWTRHVKIGVALLGFVVFAVVYDIRQFKNFSTQEAMDSAQVARNVARGKGFATDFVRPLSLYLLQKQQFDNKPGSGAVFLKGNHPDLANPPVYPALLASWMKILPFHFEIAKGAVFFRYQPETLIACLNQLFFFASILLLFRLALKLFDPAVAWMAATLFAGTEIFWRFTTSGLSTSLLVLLFLLLVWCLTSLEESTREVAGEKPKRPLVLAVAIGAILGIGALTRYSFGWLLVPVVTFFLLFLGQKRTTLSLATVGVCLAIVTPWLVRNYNLSGVPFGTATYAIFEGTTPQLDGNKLERYLNRDFESALGKVETDKLMKKFMLNAAEIIRRDVLTMGNNWAAALFLVGLLVPFLNPGLNRIRNFLLLALGMLVIVQALGRGHLTTDSPEINSENLVVILAPLAILFGVAMFFLLLDQLNFPLPSTRTLVTGVFGVVACAPLIFAMLPPRSLPIAYPPYWPPMVQDVSGWMKQDELMMSDMPWAVAWYGDRKCLWATLDAPSDLRAAKQSDFFEVHDYQKPIQGILLTRLTTDAKWFSQMIQGQDYAWGKFMLECLLRTNVPTGFPLKYSPPGFLQEGLLFLSDKNRWESGPSQRRRQPPH